MKKVIVFIIFVILIQTLLVSCDNTKSGALEKYKEFERSDNVKFHLSIVEDEKKERSILNYQLVADTLIYVEMLQGLYVEFIIDLDNNIKYYNGDSWDGMCDIADYNHRFDFTEYMTNIKTSDQDNISTITANLNVKKISASSTLFKYLIGLFSETIFDDAKIKIILINDLVEEIYIYPNSEIKEDYIYIGIGSYGDEPTNEVCYEDDYEKVKSEEEFSKKVNKDIEEIKGISSPSENEEYFLRLDYSTYYINVGGEISLRAHLYENGNHKKYVYNDSLTLKGSFDIYTPGDYQITASYQVNNQEVSDDFILTVVGDYYKTLSNTTNKSITNSKYQFAFDNYYAICANKKLYLFDLNNPNSYQLFDIKGHGKSYYVKDNYLYVTSYEDFTNYDYLDEDEYVGYITKINLNNLTIETQTMVNRYIFSIVVDKYNDVFISKAHNGFCYIEKVNLETGELTELKEQIACDAFLLYDEQSESIIVVNGGTSTNPQQFKYSVKTKEYQFIKEFGELYNYSIVDYASSKYLNKVVCDGNYYEFNNGLMTLKQIYNYREPSYGYGYSSFSNNSKSCITDERVVIAKPYQGGLIVGTYNTNTKIQNNYYIENFNGVDISSLHYYNGKIYLYNQNSGLIMFFTEEQNDFFQKSSKS